MEATEFSKTKTEELKEILKKEGNQKNTPISRMVGCF